MVSFEEEKPRKTSFNPELCRRFWGEGHENCLDKERVNQEIRAMKKEILDCWRDSTTDNFPLKLNFVLTKKLKRLGL